MDGSWSALVLADGSQLVGASVLGALLLVLLFVQNKGKEKTRLVFTAGLGLARPGVGPVRSATDTFCFSH